MRFPFSPTKKWSWQLDSNQRPADYKSAALPTELRQHSIWSGKRDSNPQPTAWKAVALAIELLPHPKFFSYFKLTHLKQPGNQ